jgi:nitrogen regulatory protein PII
MYLLVQVLEQTDRLPDLLAALAQAGVTGSTVIDTVGMGRILADSEHQGEVVETIRRILDRGRPTNKTIFTVVSDRRIVDSACEVIRSICGDLDAPGRGILFSLRLEHAEGVLASS